MQFVFGIRITVVSPCAGITQRWQLSTMSGLPSSVIIHPHRTIIARLTSLVKGPVFTAGTPGAGTPADARQISEQSEADFGRQPVGV